MDPSLLDRIPPLELEAIHLYFGRDRLTQEEIATRQRTSQPTVQYRIQRGLRRFKFLLSIPQVTEAELRRDLPELFGPMDVEVLICMWQTTCLAEVGRRLGVPNLRHRFTNAVRALQEAAYSKFEPYAKLFRAIERQPNMFRRVPTHWDKRSR
jgi:hypothetical protein